MTAINCAAEKGRQLYHAVWETVQRKFWYRARLADWQSWEHRYDELIDGEEAACRFAAEMLASLNDPYTRLIVSPATADAATNNTTRQDAPAKEAAPSGANQKEVVAILTKDNIGYLRILNFDHPRITEMVGQAAEKLADCSGLIVDLRYNHGGLLYVAADCAEYFVREGVVTTYEQYTPDGVLKRRIELSHNPHVCTWTDEKPDGTTTSEQYKRGFPFLSGKPIAILISDITASSAEMFILAVVINGYVGRCALVGKTSLGKSIVQDEDEICSGVKLRVTCGRYLAPTGEFLGNGDATTPDGIEPDTIIAEDRGPEALEAGVEAVRRMIASIAEDEK